jgi:hypothetical protein
VFYGGAKIMDVLREMCNARMNVDT